MPDLNDFVAGLKIALAERGTLSLEFPHLLNLIDQVQFDTIYQEHYYYFSLHAVCQVLEHHGLSIFDVEELPTHGGSLRILARHSNENDRPVIPSVACIRDRETAAGLMSFETFDAFGERVVNIRRQLVDFLTRARGDAKRVIGYGAPGKGNTLLNYCEVRQDLLEFVVDRNPYKHGKFLPGTHIPVYSPEKLDEIRPDYVLILPWNLETEITEQLAHIREWGGKFVQYHQGRDLKRETLPILSAQGNLRRQTGLPMASVKL